MSDGSQHSRAAGAYGSAAAATDPRALEGHVLLKSAEKLEALMRRLQSGERVSLQETSATLDHNQKLWTLLATDATEETSPLPDALKTNIAVLASYIFNRTLDIRADTTPEKFQVLININRNIAAGLLTPKQGHATSSTPGGNPPDKISSDSLA